MPTYDYGCRECGHQFELFEGIRNDGPKRCPACGRKVARRLIGKGAGLIFKGSGFYVTDYGRGGSNGGTRTEKKDAKEPREEIKAPEKGKKKEESKK
jgi:putative FmdB family regulatory protein